MGGGVVAIFLTKKKKFDTPLEFSQNKQVESKQGDRVLGKFNNDSRIRGK